MPATRDIIDQTLATLRFDAQGLIPAIAQEAQSGDVLMLAWMNPEAVRETLTTDRVCYFSRSRNALWRKGETSGHVQTLLDFRYDCDADAILMRVEQTGPACHTYRHSCFYHQLEPGGVRLLGTPVT